MAINDPVSSVPSLGEAAPNAQADHDKKQAKFEAVALARKADSEGWSEEKLTMALNDPATKSNPPTYHTPVPRKEGEVSESVDLEHPERLQEREEAEEKREEVLAKRQETNRIIRQADIEGWSDEKLLAALRIRLELRDELRARALTV